MRRFLLKLLLFALPVAGYGLISIGLPYYAGEFTPLRDVAAAQASSPTPLLFGRAYKDEFAAYKLIAAQMRRADLLVLGSSRAMQFRSELVNTGGGSFYNAGGGANYIFELRAFVEALADDETPQVLLVGLDQDWFIPVRVAAAQANPPASFTQAPLDEHYLLNTGRTVMADWLTGRWNLAQVLTRQDPITHADAIGVTAIMAGNGFRRDGSRQIFPPPTGRLSTAGQMAELRQRIAEGGERFEYTDVYAPEAIAELELFLEACARRGITVVAFAPPYAPSIWEQMTTSGHYGYLPKLSERLASLFADRGLTFIDFANRPLAGLTDANYIDGFHGSEIVYTEMYVQLLEAQPDVLGQFSDAAALRAKLEQPPISPLQLFDNN